MAEPSGRNEREVGRVTGVSNFRVTVLLAEDVRSQVRAYPHHITLVTQIGGYVLFPVAPGESAVGIVVGAFEDEAFEPGGEREMTLQLVRARRTLRINLLGKLIEEEPFVPGISTYPTLETPALLPTEEELKRILEYRPSEKEKGRDTPLEIGVSPIYARQPVTASFNDLLARPFGIMGNTGSGKSYSVASIVQEALRTKAGAANQAKIIILDINGEYSSTFPESKTSQPQPGRELNRCYVDGKHFHLPLWVFNLTEIVSFFEASQASQVPVLERVVASLRERTADPQSAKPLRGVVRLADQCRDCLGSLAAHAAEVEGKAVCDNAAEILGYLKQYCQALRQQAKGILELPEKLRNIDGVLDSIRDSGLKSADDYKAMRQKKDYTGFNRMEPSLANKIQEVVDQLEPLFEQVRNDAISKGGLREVTADSPIPFLPHELDRDALFRIAVGRFQGQERIQEYIATLRLRIHRQLADRRWSVFTDSSDTRFLGLLRAICGPDETRVVVVDCSMLAHDVLPFFCAVFGRIVLELREHSKAHGRTVQPYVLILEEAHNYLMPRREEESFGLRLARETFERIAKEGRKFGLSLVIASQRPSDVSATVLSQCANFLVHRIQNPEDIDYFKKILPTGSRDLLDQLPILSPGDALLLGSAVNVPARVKVRKPNPTPSSDTPRPWEAWQRGKSRFNIDEAAGLWSSQTASG
ncbi:MAG: DUF87 domain-containing protein [Candidatus Aminicenantales bacterium]